MGLSHKRCVKFWMGCAVIGCIITLIISILIINDGTTFESYLGPLSCELHNIKLINCCYDVNDCNYGKQYKYYFSSNDTHCMNIYDIYNHPNDSVLFSYKSSCKPSTKSLGDTKWDINQYVNFYVNKECTDWILESKHNTNIQKDILWVILILSFVACSCLSMLCGFTTMYYKDIKQCISCKCKCCSCWKKDVHNNTNKNNNDIDDGGVDFHDNSYSSSSSGDGHKHAPGKQRGRASSNAHTTYISRKNLFANDKTIPQVMSPKKDSSHLSAAMAHALYQHNLKQHNLKINDINGENVKNRNSNSTFYGGSTSTNYSNYNSSPKFTKSKRKRKNGYMRPRGMSTGSKISQLSPIQKNPKFDDNILYPIKNQNPNNNNNNNVTIKRFNVKEGDNQQDNYKFKYNLKDRIHNNISLNDDVYNMVDDGDITKKHLDLADIDEIIDITNADLASSGLSESIFYENEFYDGSGAMSPKSRHKHKHKHKQNTNRISNHTNDTVKINSPNTNTTHNDDDDDDGEDNDDDDDDTDDDYTEDDDDDNDDDTDNTDINTDEEQDESEEYYVE